ncbi:glucose-1-phosphatase [Escherichia coli]|uniref:Glucose-1-phosphatase n=1 Tax=Escherichia coli TaxID=562 RepID=A0A377DU53_ECOLX|nr:glucose-1-phosphatase [Escherichia coli]
MTRTNARRLAAKSFSSVGMTAKANRDLMKIEYVYQSAEQLRNADALTLQAPAQRVTLELSGCPIDADGFCPMDKFDSVLNEAVK